MNTAPAQTRHLTRPGFAAAGVDGWTLGALMVAGCVAVPIGAVLVLAAGTGSEIWEHLIDTVLARYIGTTLGLMAGVGAGTLIIGVGTAWLVTNFQFPGRGLFEWSLLLPLAIPSYVIAFVFTDFLEFAGPVQGLLRELGGWTSPRDYWFPEIRSLGGAIVVMSLVLYPYVYLLSRAAFLEQSVGMMEVSRSLGRGPWRSFLTVAVPLARPSIAVGVSLALMETLNDFGTVDFFAVQTLTLGIFDVWFNLNSVAGAAQIAGVILLFVMVLLAAERFSRRRQRYHGQGGPLRRAVPRPLAGFAAHLATLACALPLALGFLLPVGLLSADVLANLELVGGTAFLTSAGNSLLLAALAALVAVLIGLQLAYGVRLSGNRALKSLTRFASLGYAIPGAVLAVGVMIPFGLLDNWVDAQSSRLFGISTGLILSGTGAALVFAYVVRFLALSQGAVESGLERVTPNIDGAARTLGCRPAGVLLRVHVPLLRGSILTAAILVFVDTMKELPMTVIMRPFNFETLATQVHQFAASEQFAEASPSALAIVLAGILPVVILSRAMRNTVHIDANAEARK